MRVIKPADFIGDKAWDALDIERIKNASIRLHWTNEPYIWHVNDGPEVFVVLQGTVDMYVRDASDEKIITLQTGEIFHAKAGDEHKAVPKGTARILVIETDGSI